MTISDIHHTFILTTPIHSFTTMSESQAVTPKSTDITPVLGHIPSRSPLAASITNPSSVDSAMAQNDERHQTSRHDHEIEDVPHGFQSRGPEFRHRYQPGPQDCEDPEQYCEGGYHPVIIDDTFQGGRFTVIHKLGWGGGATVWLCQDSEEDRYVALKILQARDSSEDVHELKMHRYLQEKLNETDQRSMIALYEHFWINGPNGRHLCLVFEVAGPALASFRHWDQWRKVRPDFVRCIGLELAERLLALHQADVVFGDLSANNILFRLVDISRWTAKDVYETFGHPEPWENRYTAEDKPVDEPGVPAFLYEGITFRNCNLDLIKPELAFIDLAESYIVGTEQLPHVSAYTAIYSAPEVLLFKEKQDQASDIWALACILFELRTGEELFAGDYGYLGVQSAYIDHLGSLPGPWVTELRKQYDEPSEQEVLEADVQPNETPEREATEDHLMEDIAIDSDDQHESEVEPLVTKPKERKHSIIRCILLAIIDSIRSTGKHLYDFFHPDNLNPWIDDPDVEMNLSADVNDEMVPEEHISKVSETDSDDVAPKTPAKAKSTADKSGSASAKKRKSAEDTNGGEGAGSERAVKVTKRGLKKEEGEDDVDIAAEDLVPLEESLPIDEVVPEWEMPPSNNVVPPETIPEGLMQRIYDIGTSNLEWHNMSLDQRLERAQKFYTSRGRLDKAADTDTLMTEVNTGNAPVGELSNDESVDFANMLRSMLQYHKADRASLEDVIQHPWFTTPTTDPWELLGGEAPWIVTYHPGTNYVFDEEDDEPMVEEDVPETEQALPEDKEGASERAEDVPLPKSP